MNKKEKTQFCTECTGIGFDSTCANRVEGG